MIQSIRYAFRQLRKSPKFTLTVVLVLALGIGINSAVFTALSGVFLKPMPYQEQNRLVSIDTVDDQNYTSLNYANLQQLREATGNQVQFSASFYPVPASVLGPGGRLQITRFEVEAEMMKFLGVQPILGRSFLKEENDPGKNQVLLLSEEVWQKLFHADPAVVGKKLTMRGKDYTIIGVMPKGFSFPYGDSLGVWAPVEITAGNRTDIGKGDALPATTFARIPDGMTIAQFSAMLDSAQTAIRKKTGNASVRRLRVKSYRDDLIAGAWKPLVELYAVALGIWGLACLNVTSLLLTQAVKRNQEFAIHSALGAGRMRILRQSLLESLMLSCAGMVVGLLLGQGAIKLLWSWIAQRVPLSKTIHFDWRVMAFMVALTLLTTSIIAIIPALQASGHNLQARLRGATNTASVSQNRAHQALVLVQVSLTVVFLISAGLFLRTIYAFRQTPLGFKEQNVLTGGILMTPGSLIRSDASQPSIISSTYLPLLEKLRNIPGVKAAALSSVLPLRQEFEATAQFDLDQQHLPFEKQLATSVRLASSGLAEALGIPMRRGRFFSEQDTMASPVAVVVNQKFADKFLPGKDPLGHIVAMGEKGRFADARIVGVLGDTKQGDLISETKPELYLCLEQMTPDAPLYALATIFIQVAIRGSVPAETLRSQFDKALHEVNPDATTTGVMTIHEAVEDSFGSQTLIAYLLAIFALLALAIAVIGIYGLLSFGVAQRTREIGLRIALGASQQSIRNQILKRTLLLTGIGVTLGTVLSWFAVKVASSYLFGVRAHDGATFTAVIFLLLATACVAALLPARQAASVDPMQALRAE